VGILVVVWLIFAPAEFSYAEDEVTLQVSSSSTTTEQILPGSTVVIQTPEDIIEAAQTAISQAETATAVTKIDAISITSPTWTITDTITQAETSITQAQTVVDSATVATAEVESATVLVAEAEENVAILEIAVDSQTVVVATNQDTLDTKESELSDLQSDGSPTITYTTPGYVEPISESSTVTTTILPAMWDASTQIQTPFDIKMGDTLFNGQGTTSQIYVSSKAIISFGGPDWTYHNWPNQTQDGIYVFQSDYMSAGNDASITVKTTDVNLLIEWTLHRFGDSNGPLTYITWDMTVNPETGEWTGTGTMSGNMDVYGGPRTGIREDNVLTELTPTTTGYDQEAVAAKQSEVESAQDVLSVAQAALTLLQNDLNASEEDLINAQNNLAQAQNNLTIAIAAIDDAISNMLVSVESAETLVRQTLANEEAERVAAEQSRLAVLVAENARIAAEQAYAAEQAAAQAEAEAAEQAAAQAEAEAAAEAAAQAEAEAAEQAAAQAEADRLEAEQEAAEQAEQDRLEEEAAQEAEAKAEEEAEQQAIEDAIEKAIEDALDGKELTKEQKELVLEALLEDSNGEALSSEDIKKAGLDYEDLPPSTPVDVRTDENGNAVVITAAVAAQVELLQNPGALVEELFTNPAAAFAALGAIGADMSDAEREEATDMVIATVVAAGAAINAAAVAAAGGSTGGSSSGGGSSGGGSGANSPGSRGGRRW
jgi:hypothetical protein